MNMPFSKTTLTILGALSVAGWSGAQAQQQAEAMPADGQAAMIMTTPADIAWGDVPPMLPPGAMITVLEGDPGMAAPYALRLQMPAGYQIPAHWHTLVERVTVISGTLNAGMGDMLDPAQGKAFPAGSFLLIPGKAHHFAWADEETVVQINGDGPFDINYMDPANDPRNSQQD